MLLVDCFDRNEMVNSIKNISLCNLNKTIITQRFEEVETKKMIILN